jgi:hypothetical protein
LPARGEGGEPERLRPAVAVALDVGHAVPQLPLRLPLSPAVVGAAERLHDLTARCVPVLDAEDLAALAAVLNH